MIGLILHRTLLAAVPRSHILSPRPILFFAFASAVVLWSGSVRASSLFFENFDAAQPGSAYSAAIPGSGFQVSSGNVDIIGNINNGAPAGFFPCPNAGVGNNCLDLNGNLPGAITSIAGFNLTAGTTYALNFDLGGSIPLGKPYTMQASIGNSAPFTFAVPAANGFGTEVIDYTPTTTQAAAHIAFASTTSIPGQSQYGPLIDNVGLASIAGIPSPVGLGSTLLPTQDLAGATPGPTKTGAIAGTGFTVTAGNVDVFGASTGKTPFFTCPAPLTSTRMCIDMNGNRPGRIQSDRTFSLTAGTTYVVQFQMAGNFPSGSPAAYTLDASFGDSGVHRFSLPPRSGFQTETFIYSPTADESGAQLVFAADQNLDPGLYGPIITDIALSEPAGLGVGSLGLTEIPEPGTLVFLLTGIVSLAAISRLSRNSRW